MLQPQANCHQRFALTSTRIAGSMNKFGIVKWACIVVTICVAMAITSDAQTNLSHPSTTFTDLLNFDGANGEAPGYMSLIQGSNGNLYGTSFGGGTYDDGTIFEITTAGVLTTLYTFCSKTDCADGAAPDAGLVQDSSGNLYGTTVAGGSHFYGTVFKLSSSNKLTTLHSFKGGTTEGAYPLSGLILYNGDYYGTTQAGGGQWGGYRLQNHHRRNSDNALQLLLSTRLCRWHSPFCGPGSVRRQLLWDNRRRRSRWYRYGFRNYSCRCADNALQLHI